MSAEERTAAGQKGYENGIAKGWHDKWEEKIMMGCRREEARYNWRQRNQLERFKARIKKERAANEDSTIER